MERPARYIFIGCVLTPLVLSWLVQVGAAQCPVPDKGARSARRSSEAAAFLTPCDGDLVQPGEVLHIAISVTPEKVNGPVSIISPIGASNEIRRAPPYAFTMNITRDDNVSGGSLLIGLHQITAFGKLAGQDEYGLAAIDVDIEEREMPMSLSMRSNTRPQYRPSGSLSFYGTGEQDSVAIKAKFPNGDEFDVINSKYLKLTSGNPNVVNVGGEGWLTSIGGGNTTVTATYTLGERALKVSFPVSVSMPSKGLILNPLTLNFGDQPVGQWSDPLQVVLTNRYNFTVTVGAAEIRAPAKVSDNCTATPLPPGGSCTMSVTFLANVPGQNQGMIYIPNSQSGLISLFVFGKGI
jgi:hypothetical protein